VKFKKDPATGAMYLRLREGAAPFDPDRLPEGFVEETLELDEGVYLDLDKEGYVIGLEILSLEEWGEFLDKHPEGVEIPERVEDPTTFKLAPLN
jgi:uncharacterized protein YuzE